TPVTPVTTPTTPPIAPPSTPPTGPAALLPSRAPFWTPSTTCASTIRGAFKSMMAATPRAAHSFSRARSFDVGLVIVGSPWWIAGYCRIRFYRFRAEQVYLPSPVAPIADVFPHVFNDILPLFSDRSAFYSVKCELGHQHGLIFSIKRVSGLRRHN